MRVQYGSLLQLNQTLNCNFSFSSPNLILFLFFPNHIFISERIFFCLLSTLSVIPFLFVKLARARDIFILFGRGWDILYLNNKLIWTYFSRKKCIRQPVCPAFSSLHLEQQGHCSKENECPLWDTLSMRAHQQWLATQNHITSAVLHIPPLFLSSFLCKLLTQLNPRTFLSLFVSHILSNSNSSFSSFFSLLWQKSRSLNWLLLVPRATTLPLHPPSPLTPTNHSLKFTHPL